MHTKKYYQHQPVKESLLYTTEIQNMLLKMTFGGVCCINLSCNGPTIGHCFGYFTWQQTAWLISLTIFSLFLMNSKQFLFASTIEGNFEGYTGIQIAAVKSG